MPVVAHPPLYARRREECLFEISHSKHTNLRLHHEQHGTIAVASSMAFFQRVLQSAAAVSSQPLVRCLAKRLLYGLAHPESARCCRLIADNKLLLLSSTLPCFCFSKLFFTFHTLTKITLKSSIHIAFVELKSAL